MGKIVKYCAACEESFAEKFAFCPNCAQPLTAFEMNPVSSGGETEIADKAEPVAEEAEAATEKSVPIIEPKKAVKKKAVLKVPATAAIAAEPIVAETAPDIEIPNAETKVFAASNQTQTYNLADIEELANLDEAPAEEPAKDDFIPETKTFAAAAGANDNGNQFQANNLRSNLNSAEKSDDGYHITVIEEKNSRQRNGLLLGTLVVMVFLALSGMVFSIFNKDFGIGAIDSDNPVFLAVDESVPLDLEEQPKPKNDKDAGGGGGGGKEEPQPASKGRLVSQSENPITPPSVNIPQLKNPSLPVFMETKGNIKRPITEERPGLPGSDNLNPSNGNGRGGGIGNGIGTGIGNGNGTGEGNGNGSGSGNGNGDGTGNGRGSGNQGVKPPPPLPPAVVGPTEALKIISRPQPKYTDAARQNQVTGTVTLKVTFTASGQIGSVAPVNGLPYGLTEQAIAAAKQIRFEPPKRNGVPYAISKTVTYTFTIY